MDGSRRCAINVPARFAVGEPEEVTMVQLLAPYWSEGKVMEALGLTPAELANHRESGLILGLPDTGGRLSYPVWQFRRRPDGVVEVKPKVGQILEAFHDRVEPWTAGVLLRTPAPELDDLTPEQWIKEGRDTSALIRYAYLIAAEMNRP